ncbi:MAG: hypothetical protein JXQ27_17580 [Acidobacteria bacterium]|nr:hypothetical protein [Acidobacteriota bacterium]
MDTTTEKGNKKKRGKKQGKDQEGQVAEQQPPHEENKVRHKEGHPEDTGIDKRGRDNQDQVAGEHKKAQQQEISPNLGAGPADEKTKDDNPEQAKPENVFFPAQRIDGLICLR